MIISTFILDKNLENQNHVYLSDIGSSESLIDQMHFLTVADNFTSQVLQPMLSVDDSGVPLVCEKASQFYVTGLISQ